MRKVNPTEVKSVDQRHAFYKWQIWDSTSGSTAHPAMISKLPGKIPLSSDQICPFLSNSASQKSTLIKSLTYQGNNPLWKGRERKKISN